MVISIASQKGGTGKTSTSISLAAGLAHKGKRVLLIDIDSQANSSKVLLRHYPEIPKEQTIYATILDRDPLVVHQTHVPNLSIVPSHILLSNTDIELKTADPPPSGWPDAHPWEREAARVRVRLWPFPEFTEANRDLVATLRADGCVLGVGSAGSRDDALGLYQPLERRAP